MFEEVTRGEGEGVVVAVVVAALAALWSRGTVYSGCVRAGGF